MLFSSYPLRERQVPRWDSPLLPGGGGALGQGTEDSASLVYTIPVAFVSHS